MNNYDDYCTKLFGEHSCTKEDCPACTVAEIISEHDSNLLDKAAKVVKNRIDSYNPSYTDIYNVITELSDVVLNGIAELKAEVR